MNDLMSVLQAVKRLSIEDQRKLNKLLVANLRAANKVKAVGAAIQFNIGDVVKFDGKTRGPIYMEITTFSRDLTKAKGKQLNRGWKTHAGVTWTVGATALIKSTREAALAA